MEKFQEVKELSRDTSISPQPGFTDSLSGHINNGSVERDGRASPRVTKPTSPSPDVNLYFYVYSCCLCWQVLHFTLNEIYI